MPEQQAKQTNHESSSDEDNDRLSSNNMNGLRRLIMANTQFGEHNYSDLQSVLTELRGELVLLREQVSAMRDMTVHLDTTFQEFHRSVQQNIIECTSQLSHAQIAMDETEQIDQGVTATNQPEAVDSPRDVAVAEPAEGEKK